LINAKRTYEVYLLSWGMVACSITTKKGWARPYPNYYLLYSIWMATNDELEAWEEAQLNQIIGLRKSANDCANPLGTDTIHSVSSAANAKLGLDQCGVSQG